MKIIHVDLDCFYAAVEIRDNPALKGKAIAIGGAPEQRSVLCTCNYEARKYGVRSAMSSFKAKQLCKKLIIIPPNMAKYREVSQEIHAIFKRYTHLIEPLSLDEAYLDVTDCKQEQGSATLIAKAIRQAIFDELKLTASAGVASNKLTAKIASDINKPNGQCVVTPDQTLEFMSALPVSKLFGVGKVMQKKMTKLGIETCADLQTKSFQELSVLFGKFGESLYDYCRGIDNRPVNPKRIRKSLSVERTFFQDIPDLHNVQAQEAIQKIFNELVQRLEKHDREIRGVFVKIKFDDFSQTTAEMQSEKLLISVANQLLQRAFDRKNRAFRLLGVGVNFADQSQKALDEQMQINLLDVGGLAVAGSRAINQA